MARTKLPSSEQSKMQALRLIPLYAKPIPVLAKPKLAKNAPKGPLLVSQIERRTQALARKYPDAPAYISTAVVKRLLRELELKISPSPCLIFAKAINLAIHEYHLRLEEDLIPLSVWLPRYEKILALLRKLVPLLPGKDDLVFNIIAHFGESHAASNGPHPGLPPYELVHDFDNLLFPVNFRSSERLEQVWAGLAEIMAWMRSHLDVKSSDLNLKQYAGQDIAAAVWLAGYELPKMYERFFDRRFGRTLSANKPGPGLRFVMQFLEAAEIRASSGKEFSPQTLRTYRRRALQAMRSEHNPASEAGGQLFKIFNFGPPINFAADRLCT